MATTLVTPTLSGALVRLEPLGLSHIADLTAAAAEDRSTYTWTEVPDGEPAMRAYVEARLARAAAGERLTFAQVRLADGRAVGCTSLLSLRFDGAAATPYAVEVGGTWLGRGAQRTGVNTEAKLLLFGHAFDVWGCGRVDCKTDARNERSRAAIAATGASFEGVLRQWQPSQVAGEEGLLRDSAMYSVVRPEWPAVRVHLRRRLAAHAG